VRRLQVRIDRVTLDSKRCGSMRTDVVEEALATEIRRALASPRSGETIDATIERAVRTTFEKGGRIAGEPGLRR
jgi:hypothetical protein